MNAFDSLRSLSIFGAPFDYARLRGYAQDDKLQPYAAITAAQRLVLSE